MLGPHRALTSPRCALPSCLRCLALARCDPLARAKLPVCGMGSRPRASRRGVAVCRRSTARHTSWMLALAGSRLLGSLSRGAVLAESADRVEFRSASTTRGALSIAYRSEPRPKGSLSFRLQDLDGDGEPGLRVRASTAGKRRLTQLLTKYAAPVPETNRGNRLRRRARRPDTGSRPQRREQGHPDEVYHYSIQGTHLHLIVKAEGRDALSRGMRGLGTRIARRLNSLAKRSGAARSSAIAITAVVLTSRRQVANARRYVLENYRHHTQEYLGPDWLDSLSTAGLR
jgi:hypothetical protein